MQIRRSVLVAGPFHYLEMVLPLAFLATLSIVANLESSTTIHQGREEKDD